MDLSPSFHPNDSAIYFLSDRRSGSDGPTHVYRVSLDSADSAPQPVAPFDTTESVSSYAISPNGAHIAFISQNKPEKKDEKEGIEIWREKKDLGSLRVFSLSSSDDQR